MSKFAVRSARPEGDGGKYGQDWNRDVRTIADGVAPDGTWQIRRYVPDGMVSHVSHDPAGFTDASDIEPSTSGITHVVRRLIKRFRTEEAPADVETTIHEMQPGEAYVLPQPFLSRDEAPLTVVVRTQAPGESREQFLAHTPYEVIDSE